MNISQISADTRVLPSALPLHFDGGEDALLMIHGYTGYPGEYRYVGERLAEAGFSVYIPRLPGHGTNRRDFLQTRGEDWLRHCLDRYMDLSARHRKVYVAGLSLGGVLTAILAGRFSPERIALLAPAVTNRDKRIVLTPALKHIVPRIRGRFREESEDPDRQYLWKEYWRYKHSKSAAEVYKLQRIARRELGKIRSDTLIIVSKDDPTVSWKVAEYIDRTIPPQVYRKIIHLENSGHMLVNGEEKESVAEALVSWFRKD